MSTHIFIRLLFSWSSHTPRSKLTYSINRRARGSTTHCYRLMPSCDCSDINTFTSRTPSTQKVKDILPSFALAQDTMVSSAAIALYFVSNCCFFGPDLHRFHIRLSLSPPSTSTSSLIPSIQKGRPCMPSLVMVSCFKMLLENCPLRSFEPLFQTLFTGT